MSRPRRSTPRPRPRRRADSGPRYRRSAARPRSYPGHGGERRWEIRRSTAGPGRYRPRCARHRGCAMCRGGSAGRACRPRMGARRADHVVHAMPGLAVARCGGVIVMGRRPRHSTGGCAGPRFAAILGGEDARGGDGEPEFRRVVGIGDQRVQRQARRAGGPVRAIRELGERGVRLPRHAAIGGGQKLRRLRPGVEASMGVVQRPDRVEACRRTGRACPAIRSWRRNRGRSRPIDPSDQRRASTATTSRRHRWTARRPHRASRRHPRPRSCPLAGSPVMWLIGQPSQWGPETSHSVRSSLAVRMKAPFVVPTSRCVVPDMVRLSPKVR
jgi:hypothetical protein